MSTAVKGNMIQVAKVGEIADGAMKEVSLQGKPLLLARVKDRYFAAAGRCPHMGGNLSKGALSGTVVTCPKHFSQFDLADGHVVRWTNWTGIKLGIAKAIRPPRPLKTYPVKVEGDRILVDIGQ